MKLNADLIRQRCLDIADSLQRLEAIRGETKENFLNNRDLQDIACYRFLVAIESALNLCYHVSAKSLQKIPEEYAECFAILAEAGIIDAHLCQNLQKMARFRNLLVHMYWKIDYEAIYHIMKNNLGDLRSFAGIVAGLL